jgi:hypothetical protein
MAKLHELLAVDGNLKSQAEKLRSDLEATFEKKRHLFEEKRITFQPSAEGAPATTEAQSDLQTTVRGELEWIAKTLTKAIDVSHAINVGNTQAVADVRMDDGLTILAGVPATTLLELEKRLKEIFTLVNAVPTLDPAKGFQPAPDRGAGIYKAREEVKTRTAKQQRPLVLYPATPEHPAQTQIISEDVPIGRLHVLEFSSMVTPAEKAALLERIENLTRAVKSARARANETEVDVTGNRIGAKLMQYILGA